MNEYMLVMAQVAPIANAIVGLGVICAIIVYCWNAIKLLFVVPWKYGWKVETALIMGISIMCMIAMFAFISVTIYWTLVTFSAIVTGYWFSVLIPLWKQEGISKIQVALAITGNPLAWIPAIVFIFLRKRNENAETVQEVPA